jgi:uncharacterized protein
MNIINILAQEFSIKQEQVTNVVSLLDDGNTVPFIARYRKEAHGSLDDQVIRAISDRLDYLRSLDKRKEEITKSMSDLNVLTDELSADLEKCTTLAQLEDVYRPYKPKRRTRATVAAEKGLVPLADAITEAMGTGTQPSSLAEPFINEEKGVLTADDALLGASDIIAERVSDNAEIRSRLRNLTSVNGILVSQAADKEKESVYENYYDYSEKLSKAAGHKILALDRGEKEGFLKVGIQTDSDHDTAVVCSVIAGDKKGPCADFVRNACKDAYERLIKPAVQREIRAALTQRADEQAIKVFADNLSHLLMQPPLRGAVVLGLDPGYRTGCKTAVVDPTGKVLYTGVIYPTHGKERYDEAKKTVKALVAKFGVTVFSIGNGTASKETEAFAADTISEISAKVSYMVVSEAGASVYSASKLGAAEFPQFDVSVRSAVSIARRLQDPLAELVKIDPEAIGVGQYQHDMPAKELAHALDGVVEDCVNSVGADLNTASPSLLGHIAGISSAVASNICAYREENGAFTSRTQLKKVPKLGPSAFEQCAGFLRVTGGKEALDATAVHPESYKSAKMLMQLCGYSEKDLLNGSLPQIAQKAEQIGINSLAQQTSLGVPTLRDIIKELSRPARDPRDELEKPVLRTDLLDIKDLRPGMQLTGTVRNVVDFGAFIDIGVHRDGLVHISEISDHYIKHPSEVLSVGDIVNVTVKEVDTKKERISLTMLKTEG